MSFITLMCCLFQMWVRANFDYDPQRDSLIPCPQAGLAFRRGDVLHIVCSSDALWWQARKAHDTRLRAGLVPSRQLQQRWAGAWVGARAGVWDRGREGGREVGG